ncbi:hypothetical protein BSIN_1471 [Burkholderia singularis]|uniref:Uncharacterized protein n=1 Tax=Burkholderia singularis TaxID=1503053 RepID=A0A238GYY7_9BURK|nr:hypothetical protein BSIN_1471 [Burkholderia singularis]
MAIRRSRRARMCAYVRVATKNHKIAGGRNLSGRPLLL